MFYRELGTTKEKVSILGLDTVNLPLLNDNHDIDITHSDEIIKFSLDNGINYIDICHHGTKYESYLSDFFDRYPEYREKVLISSKMPVWLINNKDDLCFYFKKQLETLNCDCIDVYLLDLVNPYYWKKLVKFGVLEFLDKIKDESLVKYTGFSFHGELELFFEIIDTYVWDLTQIQFNFMDVNNEAGFEGIRYAKNNGIGVVAMKPLLGGCLTNNIPSDIQEIWNLADDIKTPAEWCLNFIWDYEEIDIVLSGMSTLDQVKENISFANKALPDCMTSNDKDIIKEVRFAYRNHINVNCDKCGYCMPCSEGVDIPKNFEILNNMYMFSNNEDDELFNIKIAKNQYDFILTPKQRASNCNACGYCEKLCPNFINIVDKLSELEEIFND